MPVPSTITIADATPTNHDFFPVAKNAAGTWLLLNREAVTAAGAPRLELGFSLANRNRATDKVHVKFVHPFEAEVDGVTVVQSTPLFDGSFVIPADLTVAQRERFAKMAANVVLHTIVQGMVKSRDPMY
jgi:hypothetical protein